VPEQEKKQFNIKPPYMIYEAPGCAKCANKGTVGRVAICEVMEMTKNFEKLILKRPSESEIEAEGKAQGMVTLKMDAVVKALLGYIGFDEAMRIAEFQDTETPQGMRVGK
jgi:type II secretory ATPase GspE/PulE/Tfp pilus assembly ATPase PilB-like protein